MTTSLVIMFSLLPGSFSSAQRHGFIPPTFKEPSLPWGKMDSLATGQCYCQAIRNLRNSKNRIFQSIRERWKQQAAEELNFWRTDSCPEVSICSCFSLWAISDSGHRLEAEMGAGSIQRALRRLKGPKHPARFHLEICFEL